MHESGPAAWQLAPGGLMATLPKSKDPTEPEPEPEPELCSH